MRTFKRSLAGMLIAVVIGAGVVGPYKQVRAAFPIPVVAGVMLVFDSGALAWSYAAATALVATGAALLGIKFYAAGGTEALDVRLNPKAPYPVPSGWAAGATAGAIPVPPGSIAATPGPRYSIPQASGAVFDGLAAFVASSGQSSITSGIGTGLCETGRTGGVCGATPFEGCSVPTNYTVCKATVYTCPTGYSVSGTSCTLVTPSVVVRPSDTKGQLNMTTTGSAVVDTLDPDNSSGMPANVEVGTGRIDVTDASNNKRTTIINNTDGSVTVTQLTGRGDGTSDREALTFAPRNGSASNGGMAATGGLKDRVIGEGGAASPTAPGNAPPQQGQITPCGLGGSSPNCKIDETGTPTGTGAHDASQTSVLAAVGTLEAKVLEQTSKTLPWTWSWSVPAFSCASWDFVYVSSLASRTWSATVDWCPWLEKARDIWGWVLSVITLIYIWRSFTSNFKAA